MSQEETTTLHFPHQPPGHLTAHLTLKTAVMSGTQISTLSTLVLRYTVNDFEHYAFVFWSSNSLKAYTTPPLLFQHFSRSPVLYTCPEIIVSSLKGLHYNESCKRHKYGQVSEQKPNNAQDEPEYHHQCSSVQCSNLGRQGWHMHRHANTHMHTNITQVATILTVQWKSFCPVPHHHQTHKQLQNPRTNTW